MTAVNNVCKAMNAATSFVLLCTEHKHEARKVATMEIHGSFTPVVAVVVAIVVTALRIYICQQFQNPKNFSFCSCSKHALPPGKCWAKIHLFSLSVVPYPAIENELISFIF